MTKMPLAAIEQARLATQSLREAHAKLVQLRNAEAEAQAQMNLALAKVEAFFDIVRELESM